MPPCIRHRPFGIAKVRHGRSVRLHFAPQRGVKWLTLNLLVAYLAMIAAQQRWVLLNSDVRELVKRVTSVACGS